ncbi:MAG: ABC transporter substrate-binding protein [Actinomycetes bacterium]
MFRVLGSARRATLAVAVAAATVLLAACSEPEPTDPQGAPTTAAVTGVTAGPGDGRTVLSKFSGATWFNGDVPKPTTAKSDRPAIRVGFVSVDSGPIGAMPELHTATDAAVRFINTELGGVRGAPVELVPCVLSNPMSPEEAQGCGRTFIANDVVAVLGGIGLAQGPLLEVLENNQIPYVGGLPVNEAEMSSTASFQFSGGGPGAFAAFADQAVRRDGARRVAVLFADYPSIRNAAVDYGAGLATSLGAEKVTTIPFPMGSQDYSTVAQKAVDARPDAIFVGAADLACVPIMQAIADLRSTAKVYMVGSCADRKFLDRVGLATVAGTRFNVENRIDLDQVPEADFPIYLEAMRRYGADTNPLGAATVSFRDAMNLWAAMRGLSGPVTGGALTKEFRAARNAPSFTGHPYTCDGQQIPALPALCAAQQVVAELRPDGSFSEASDGWIDVPKLIADHPVGDAANE